MSMQYYAIIHNIFIRNRCLIQRRVAIRRAEETISNAAEYYHTIQSVQCRSDEQSNMRSIVDHASFNYRGVSRL